MNEATWEKRAEREQRSREEAATKRLAIAAAQRRQHDEKTRQSVEQQRKKMEEGQHIRRLDHAYHSQEQERVAQRRHHQTQLMANIHTMRDRARSEKQAAAHQEHQQDQHIADWYAKKERLEKMRKDAEEHHFKYVPWSSGIVRL